MKNYDIITEIARIRGHNNIQWMSLMQLALEAAPKQAKYILKQITKNDKAITKLTSKIK